MHSTARSRGRSRAPSRNGNASSTGRRRQRLQQLPRARALHVELRVRRRSRRSRSRARPGTCRRSQVSTWRCAVSDATTRNRSSSSLVTVRSASSVPPLVEPLRVRDPARRARRRRSPTAGPAAAGVRPCTRNFAMNDMSISPTPSRTARCSAAQWSNQLCRPQVSGSAVGRQPGVGVPVGALPAADVPEVGARAPPAGRGTASASHRAPSASCATG